MDCRKILVLAGTSDAKELAVKIKHTGYAVLATVVTENAAKSLSEADLDVNVGRLTAEEMATLIDKEKIVAVVDASHPYAEEASKNAVRAAEIADVAYLRYERESQVFEDKLITMVDDYAQAAELADQKKGVIMLTTGSKTLSIFTERLLGLPETRLIARMLPRIDNMQKCEQLGMEQKNIVAMQGPFSKELNKALYAHYQVTLMITKESGKVGAVDEKVEAAKEMGIETIMIRRPKMEYGNVFHDFEGIIKQLKGEF